MKLSIITVGICCIAVVIVPTSSQKCDDIDTAACHLLAAQRPNLCSDATLAQSACPRYCKLCPIECHHCNATVFDYHECNETQLCAQGEVCMLKELKSFVDGHHEYSMTCGKKEVCDGAGLQFPFGKREIQSRDLTVKCCSEDLCNYPETQTMPTIPMMMTTMMPTTTGCKKDIIFVVDESDHMLSYNNPIVNVIARVIDNLPIGQDASLVSLATYATRTTTKFNLNAYTDKISLENAVRRIVFRGGTADLNDALSYVLQHASSSAYGNRLNVPDVVVIISASSSHNHLQLQSLKLQLNRESSDVINVIVGHHRAEHVATDQGHEIMLQGLTSEFPLLEKQLLSLICQ